MATPFFPYLELFADLRHEVRRHLNMKDCRSLCLVCRETADDVEGYELRPMFHWAYVAMERYLAERDPKERAHTHNKFAEWIFYDVSFRLLETPLLEHACYIRVLPYYSAVEWTWWQSEPTFNSLSYTFDTRTDDYTTRPWGLQWDAIVAFAGRPRTLPAPVQAELEGHKDCFVSK